MPGLAVFGVTGRMGQHLVRALREQLPGPGGAPALRLCGALASPQSPRLGRDAAAEGEPSGVIITADPTAALADADAALEFSPAPAVAGHARACAARRVGLLVGTTGLDEAALAALEEAAARIPVLIAPNTSVGVTVIAQLLDQAARALGRDYEVRIREAHHRLKRDAPSGTALALGETVARARGHGPECIDYEVVREGDIVGEHTVSFSAPGERIEVTHRATDRMIFARGALRAAEWLAGRTPGLYGMQDVLGLEKHGQ